MLSHVSGIAELKSDLHLEWMGPELRICHCALNQLSYLISQKRKELRIHMHYTSPQYMEKCNDFLAIRRKILNFLFESNIVQK